MWKAFQPNVEKAEKGVVNEQISEDVMRDGNDA